jgi:hypothetical protein
LRGEEEDPDSPPNRLGRYLKRCYHHSCVVVDRKPSSSEVQEYLFHLRRAQGNENRPSAADTGVDAVLIPRTNRYIGVRFLGLFVDDSILTDHRYLAPAPHASPGRQARQNLISRSISGRKSSWESI